jgi:hypothetical protein
VLVHTFRKPFKRALCKLLVFAPSVWIVWCAAPKVDVTTIIERSASANDKDFEAAPHFNYKETDHDAKSTRTFQVTMIDGSPYRRLLAVNGRRLSQADTSSEWKKEERETALRRGQSPAERSRRVADYEKDRQRDHLMMTQLSKAFDFKIAGVGNFSKRKVWILRAIPKPNYQPPNLESKVLPGMQGEMWIDQQTYEWLKVTAEVIRPVSIEGFLARVEPGTRFEIEKIPVAAGVWQISHFSMHSRAKVLSLISKTSAEEDWYYDFKPVDGAKTMLQK